MLWVLAVEMYFRQGASIRTKINGTFVFIGFIQAMGHSLYFMYKNCPCKKGNHNQDGIELA